jgi:hypothetical protein
MSPAILQQAMFNVYDGNGDENFLISVEVVGLGTVFINRTDEGIIVDVYNKTDGGGSNDCLGSLAIQSADFFESYGDRLQKEIDAFDAEATVDNEFIALAYTEELTIPQAVTRYFSSNPFDVATLSQPDEDDMLLSVEMEPEPVIALTSSQHQLLGRETVHVTNGGKRVKVALTGTGPVLLPLKNEPIKAALPLSQTILSRKFITEDQAEQFSAIRFLNWGTDLDSGTFELDVTFQEADDEQDRFSFSVLITFDWDGNETLLSLGSNFGDGRNEHITMEVIEGAPLVDLMNKHIAALKQSAPNDKYLGLIERFPSAHREVIEGVQALSVLLKLK